MRAKALAAVAGLTLALAGCNDGGVGDTVKSAGSAVAKGVGSVPSLVNVNLKDVLNDLAVNLNLDRANIPINAQIPITLAANVCGVSINILSVSTGGQANCTAKTSSPELAQVVQQQVAAGGSVGGGAQGGSTSGTSGTTATTGGTAGSGATGTTGQSTGTQTGTLPQPQPEVQTTPQDPQRL
jgi:hypothetical protein